MNSIYFALLISALFFLGASAQTTQPIQWPFNGHCYQVVSAATALNFSSALTAANNSISNTGFRGYLATITAVNEEAFISNLITTTVAYYTGALAVGGQYIWQAGPEAGQVVLNATGCQQASCFGLTTVTAGSAIALFNRTFVAALDSLLLGYIIEFDNCLPTPSPSASVSAVTTTTTTGTTTVGASLSPSTFRPTITLGTLTTGKGTTGKRGTTGRRRTTGRRGTTGKVSAAGSMSFSAVVVAIAATTMLFFRR